MNTLELILDNNYKLDFTDEAELKLVYQISDIREYDKRKSSYSYPFTLPGTHNNNQAFGYIYNVQSDTQFDPNIRASFKIVIDTDVVFVGFLQLNRVIINNDTNAIQYEVTAYSNILNLFETITSKELCDLDMSEFNHEYSKEAVINSWDNWIWRNGIKYPFKKGNGYVYPYVNYFTRDAYYNVQPNANKLKTEFFFPHIYVRTLVDKIFESAGFSYESNFMASELFNSLIISPNPEGLEITKELAKDWNFKAKINVPEVVPGGDPVGRYWRTVTSYDEWWGADKFPYDYDDDVLDPPQYFDLSGNYNAATYVYTVPNKCRMSFTAELKYKVTYTTSAFSQCSVSQPVVYNGEEWFYGWLIRKRNGVESILDSIILKKPISFTATKNCTTFTRSTQVSCNEVEFLPGDEVYVYIDLWSRVQCATVLGQQLPANYLYYLLASDFSGNIVNQTILEGNPIDFSKLNYCQSQKDFLLSLIRMFNLYIEPDADDETKLYIEPRDDFYSSTTTIDWTKKLDRSSQWDLIPIPEVSTSKLILKYNEDSDYLNTDYQETYREETFGQFESNFRNDWQTTISANTLLFANSPLVNEVDTDRILPEVYEYVNNIKKFKAWKMRIFYYKGLVDTQSPFEIYTVKNGNYTSENIEYNRYPYAGYLDSPEDNPTLDLNFYLPKQNYFAQTQFTPNNLYNTYWRNYLENIFDKNAKMLTGQFYLTPYDIHTLNLRNLIYLDGLYWYINKIDGFDPLRPSLTTVELIQLINQPTQKDYILYENVLTGVPASGTGDWFGNPLPGTRTSQVKRINTSSNNTNTNNNSDFAENSSQNMVAGDNNFIHGGSKKSLTLGDNNQISSPKSSIILGDNNVIGNFENSIFMGNNFQGLTQSYEYSLVVGTGPSYSVASFYDIINSVNYIGTQSGPTYAVPYVYNNKLTYGRLYYDESQFSMIFQSATASDEPSIRLNNGELRGRNDGCDLLLTFVNIYQAGNTIYNSNNSSILTSPSSCMCNSQWSSIIGGYSQRLVDTTSSFIGGGCCNTLTTSNFDAMIGGSYNCNLQTSDSTIIGGKTNNLNQVCKSSIVGGCQNLIEYGNSNTILNGGKNVIYCSNYSSVIGGYLNCNSSSSHSSIIGGQSNLLNTTSYSSILGGMLNTTSISQFSTTLGGYQTNINCALMSSVVGGRCNQIDNTQYSGIIGGVANKICCYSHRSSILGGQQNLIHFSSFNSSIVNGSYNCICSNSQSTLVAGKLNSVLGYNYNNNLNGCCNLIINTEKGNIINGFYNCLNYNTNSSILNGCYNYIGYCSNQSSVIGGISNRIYCQSTAASIVGGQSHKIFEMACRSAIVGGDSNTLCNSCNSVIIGGNSLVLDTQNDAVLVPSFLISGSFSPNNASNWGLTNDYFVSGFGTFSFNNGVLINVIT